MSDRWFFRQRQEWIAQMVRIYGYINREHLEKKFEISTPQASMDLQYFGYPDFRVDFGLSTWY